VNAEKCNKADSNMPAINSERLFAGQRTLLIKHRGEYYTLRITANDKLILTK